MMRLSARISAAVAALSVLFVSAICAVAQSTAPTGKPTRFGTYSPTDPLAGVRYDNRYDLSVGMAYDHMKAGPNLLQGSNTGGLDLSGSYWLTRRLGVEGSGRAYVGTSGAAPNPYSIQGPFVAQYFFTGGPEFLGPHNKHGDLIAHALVGGVYGDFEKDLRGQSPAAVGFYNNQMALAMIVGGHMDLNRSPRWVLRVTPDAVITHYGINYPPNTHQWDVNFAISVGVEYKFRKTR